MDTLPFSLPTFDPGWVWLVGAGPGDPGLLTLLAAHALGHADVVVYDALVDQGALALANPDAELVYAGKRGGKPSPKQPDITNSLIALALEGKKVLRLKGGDPFVFGRGAEEARALSQAGIPFRVVPGVTAGVGGLAYAGIPATTRDTNAAVTFVTGHASTGEVPDGIRWPELAKGSPVIVFYMALKHLPTIIERLIDGGRDPADSAAVVASAATPEQRVVTAPLKDLGEAVTREGIAPPAIVVVGRTVDFREHLDWWTPAPAAAPPSTAVRTVLDAEKTVARAG
ncbi:Uroporphyrinogen-III methyltransferase [Caenispirillum salinarum AK4]|uniref:uroporphyrinogen-III C-methyltransferase n=1 Tax=Caenispirillum salinarum AK4 TaxID=1238182 RepID=K9H1A9_9PROT|nr:uroporphyrinogen-III C-methyltransferase [Caenispirillum salinarum]EKV32040.1 Uroporphyrinogen-III methyltransferase [Caenispirillum salinarum AK4]